MNLLLEIGCEEIPPLDVKISNKFLLTHLPKELKINLLSYQTLKVHTTSRRIIIYINSISLDISTVNTHNIQIKHPFDNQQRLKKASVSLFHKHILLEHANIAFYNKQPLSGIIIPSLNPISYIVTTVILKILTKIPFTSSMTWNNSNMKFVRPITWILCLLNNKTLPFVFANITSSNCTHGHRLLFKTIKAAKESIFFTFLKKNKIILESKKRKHRIILQAKTLAKHINAQLVRNQKLENSLSNSSESPFPLLGCFHPKYLKIPHEILCCEIENKQRSLIITNHVGNLLPFFITVASIIPKNANKLILGHEKIIQARFQDGLFYFKEDLKNQLLSESSFSIQNWILQTANAIKYSNKKILNQTLPLSKADLKTSIVNEFPDLQGIIGGIYSKYLQISRHVSNAIYEQYLPKFISDEFPLTKLGIILSISNNLTILHNYPTPKSNNDPFGIRKSAINLIKTIIYHNINNNLAVLTENQTLINFIQIRSIYFFNEKFPTYLTDLCYKENPNETFYSTNFLLRSNFSIIFSIHKRIKNMLEKKEMQFIESTFFISTSTEKTIYNIINQIISPNLDKNITLLSSIKPHLNALFETTIILSKNKLLQQNRLQLLLYVYNKISNIINIKALEKTTV